MNESITSAHNLSEFASQTHQYHGKLEQGLGRKDLTDVRRYVMQMQQAVFSVFGHHNPIIIGGEQSILPLPKNFAKLVAMHALHETMGLTTIGLRADHDLAGSERDIRGSTIPNAGNQGGVAKFTLFGDNSREAKLIISGINLPNKTIAANMAKTIALMRQAYSGNFNINHRALSVFDEQVAADWMACYGLDMRGNQLSHLPSHLTQGNMRSNADELTLQLPHNLAQAHENWYLWLQRQFAIEPMYTVSEGKIDPFLLQNGGIEVLQYMWRSTLKNLMNAHYNPVAMRLDEKTLNKTPFNIAQDGIRLESYFDEHDDTVIHTRNPVTRHEQTITLQDALDEHQNRYTISLSAVPRVVLYSLAGLSGHVTGGGSIYNHDAKKVMTTNGLPYFPLWNFESGYGPGHKVKVSPIQYLSIAIKAARGDEPRIDMENASIGLAAFGLFGMTTHIPGIDQLKSDEKSNVEQMILANVQGMFGLIDFAMSVNPAMARDEIAQFIRGHIDRNSRLILTNRSGKRPPKINL